MFLFYVGSRALYWNKTRRNGLSAKGQRHAFQFGLGEGLPSSRRSGVSLWLGQHPR